MIFSINNIGETNKVMQEIKINKMCSDLIIIVLLVFHTCIINKLHCDDDDYTV